MLLGIFSKLKLIYSFASCYEKHLKFKFCHCLLVQFLLFLFVHSFSWSHFLSQFSTSWHEYGAFFPNGFRSPGVNMKPAAVLRPTDRWKGNRKIKLYRDYKRQTFSVKYSRRRHRQFIQLSGNGNYHLSLSMPASPLILCVCCICKTSTSAHLSIM